MNLLEKIFGANWRTSITGAMGAFTALLTILAAMPYELGDVAEIIPPHWKGKIAAVGAVATFMLRMIHSHVSKDKEIGGNGSIEDPYKEKGPDNHNMTVPIILASALLLNGCAGMSPAWKAAAKDLAGKAAEIAVGVITDSATSRSDKESKAAYLDSAAYGLRAEMPTIDSGAGVRKTVDAYTPAGKGHWNELATDLAHIYDTTPGPEKAKVEAVAEGLNQAALKARN